MMVSNCMQTNRKDGLPITAMLSLRVPFRDTRTGRRQHRGLLERILSYAANGVLAMLHSRASRDRDVLVGVVLCFVRHVLVPMAGYL